MGVMNQPTLWDKPASSEEQTSYHVSKEDIIVVPIRWANGDTAPEALERLALVMLGDLSTGFRRADTGEHVFYRVIATGVVDGQVLCAHQYLCTASEFYGGTGSTLVGQEEDEE